MSTAAEVSTAILAKLENPPLGSESVSKLLQESQAAHRNYRDAVRRQQSEQAFESLTIAARTRAQAEMLDPDHANAAWSDSAAHHSQQQINQDQIHADLLEFYLRELSK